MSNETIPTEMIEPGRDEAETRELKVIPYPEVNHAPMVDLSLTVDDIERVSQHLERVKEVVANVLVEGINNDYGLIKGTPKKSLLKPGAEKLMRLFCLGIRFDLIDKEFCREENFSMYEYKATVYHLASGKDIAQCEAACNSQEKKYAMRAHYKDGAYMGKEVTPICDIVNTMKKMAQKRAMVGAVIIAVGASDYFSQDPDEVQRAKGNYTESAKTDSGRFDSDDGPPGDYVIAVGKFKGKKISEVGTKELISYCTYITKGKEGKEINGKMKTLIDTARDYLKTVPKKG